MNQLKVIQKFLRAARRPRHNPKMTWSQAGKAASLEFGNGYPMSAGLAQLIAGGSDVANEAFRQSYKLGPRRCAHCHQRIKNKKKIIETSYMKAHMRWWKSRTVSERDRIIQNCFELEGSYTTQHKVRNEDKCKK